MLCVAVCRGLKGILPPLTSSVWCVMLWTIYLRFVKMWMNESVELVLCHYCIRGTLLSPEINVNNSTSSCGHVATVYVSISKYIAVKTDGIKSVFSSLQLCLPCWTWLLLNAVTHAFTSRWCTCCLKTAGLLNIVPSLVINIVIRSHNVNIYFKFIWICNHLTHWGKIWHIISHFCIPIHIKCK